MSVGLTSPAFREAFAAVAVNGVRIAATVLGAPSGPVNGFGELLVTVIFVQIVVTLVLVGVLARREPAVPGAARAVGRHVAPGMAPSQS